MHSRALANTFRQALFTIFVRPALTPFATAILQNPQLCSPSTLRPLSNPLPPRRNLNVYRKVTRSRRTTFEDVFLVDERIGSLKAHLVDAENKIQPIAPLQELLRNIDRSTDCLRKVSETEDGIPLVKVYSQDALRTEARSKMVVKEKKDKKGDDGLTKQVELTWAITENDLGYRLNRLENFLREGKRVEVLIAPKKGGRIATKVEIIAVLKDIRDKVAEVEGANEWKTMDGVPGKEATLYFQSNEHREQAKEAQKARAKEVLLEKFDRKEKEKAENKEKLERRLARKKEYEERKGKLIDISMA